LLTVFLFRVYVHLQDVTHAKMRRRIENPRILLLDCPLEYKKGESQVRRSWTVSGVGCCVVCWLLLFVRVVVEICISASGVVYKVVLCRYISVVRCSRHVPCCVLAGARH
jgi:hypothetical protein